MKVKISRKQYDKLKMVYDMQLATLMSKKQRVECKVYRDKVRLWVYMENDGFPGEDITHRFLSYQKLQGRIIAPELLDLSVFTDLPELSGAEEGDAAEVDEETLADLLEYYNSYLDTVSISKKRGAKYEAYRVWREFDEYLKQRYRTQYETYEAEMKAWNR